MHLGYYDEARAWRDWIIRAVAGSPEQIQIMYGVGGERWLPELIVPWLPGYENSSPIRIGNAAYQQLQLDVFGEVADVMLQTLKAGMPIPERGRALRPIVLAYLAGAWRQPDEGIWEIRGEPQHFVHSKVMAWVAFDRAANAVETEGFGESFVADRRRCEPQTRGANDMLDFIGLIITTALMVLIVNTLIIFIDASRAAKLGRRTFDGQADAI
jgi:GH15 family glucan-1,4-alpha-glucosidase